MKKNLQWMRLDNAALIFPAAKRKNWTNVYRISFTLKEEIDPDMLDIAIKHVVLRFPSICVRVKPGFFWYYLEELPYIPSAEKEDEYNINKMKWKDIKKCAFRVLYYKNRISCEYFHAVTDGTGGMIFAKNICAEYIRIKYRIDISYEDSILNLKDKPQKSELEDSFRKHSSSYWTNESEPDSFMINGTPTGGFVNLTTGIISIDDIKQQCSKYNATITVYLAAVLMKSFYQIQEATTNPKKRKNIGIQIPINLRKLFDSNTFRNFVLCVTPRIDPRLGEYSFEEMINVIKNTMGLENTRQKMRGRFSYNVCSELHPILRMSPLFLKNIAMKNVYNKIAERKSCICMSNLGNIQLPSEMMAYVDRTEFIVGMLADSHISCSICGYDGKLYINFVRNINESEVERLFFTELRKSGIHVLIESNLGSR